MKTPLEKISLAMLEWMAKSQEEALALVCTCGIMRFTFSRTPRGQTVFVKGLRRWSGLLHSLQQGLPNPDIIVF